MERVESLIDNLLEEYRLERTNIELEDGNTDKVDGAIEALEELLYQLNM